MDLNQMRVLVSVVDAGSFSGAARVLGMPKSTVSAHVAQLENHLGVRLLQRTTRSLGLTDAGKAFYARCARIVADADEAECAVADLQAAPRGLLRVTAPVEFSQTFMGGIVAAFGRAHPDVRVELVATDQVLDLVESGFDVAVRAGPQPDSSLIAKKLRPIESYLYASADYLARARGLRTPADLERHACLVFSSPANAAAWTLRNQRGREAVVAVQGPLVSNSLRAVRDAAVGGLGIALLPVFVCERARELGGLVRVLPGWRAGPSDLQIVYPSVRHLSPKVRAFVTAASERLDADAM